MQAASAQYNAALATGAPQAVTPADLQAMMAQVAELQAIISHRNSANAAGAAAAGGGEEDEDEDDGAMVGASEAHQQQQLPASSSSSSSSSSASAAAASFGVKPALIPGLRTMSSLDSDDGVAVRVGDDLVSGVSLQELGSGLATFAALSSPAGYAQAPQPQQPQQQQQQHGFMQVGSLGADDWLGPGPGAPSGGVGAPGAMMGAAAHGQQHHPLGSPAGMGLGSPALEAQSFPLQPGQPGQGQPMDFMSLR